MHERRQAKEQRQAERVQSGGDRDAPWHAAGIEMRQGSRCGMEMRESERMRARERVCARERARVRERERA